MNLTYIFHTDPGRLIPYPIAYLAHLDQKMKLNEEEIKCFLLTSSVVSSRQQVIEERRRDPLLLKIIKTMKDSESMALEKMKARGSNIVSFFLIDNLILLLKILINIEEPGWPYPPL